MNKAKKIFLALIFLLIFNSAVFAEQIEKTKAIRAIIGEASNQGYTGMLAVACAIRNRGTLKGVYGLNAKHIDNEPQWVFILAEKAWQESSKKDLTNGATMWENIRVFGMPNWDFSKLIKVYEHKDHIFFKEIKSNEKNKTKSK